MSKVKIQGNASGTGTVTVTAPNTNADRTITLPDGDVTLATNENFTSTGIDDNATSTAITIDSSENVGIGVVPESDWDIYNAFQIGRSGAIFSYPSADDLYMASNAKYAGGAWKYIGTAKAQHIGMDTGGAIKFKVAPSGTADSAISWTTALNIQNDGDIDIGTYSGTGSTKGYHIAHENNTTKHYHSCTATDTQWAWAFTNPNGVVGSIKTVGSATQFNTSSDYRLKENVVPMTGAIDRLKALKPSRFNFIADADTTVDGFLAHEAQEVVPEAISGEKDAMKMEEYEVTPAVMDGETVVTEAVMGEREVPDYQGIDQAKLVPLLTSALQDAIEKIEKLESRITAMEVS